MTFLQMFQPPPWVTGGISTGDAAFLVELVRRETPATVLEIGVAAGTSSAALLYALDQLPGKRVLYSVDIRPTCYFDPRRTVGSAVATMYPDHRAGWILDLNGATRRDGSVVYDLAFIDGNHQHPWPLLDVLQLVPWLRSASWIALHDIALASVHPRFQTFGVQWLYQAWPGEKFAGEGDARNIGAVRLPISLTDLVPMALDLIEDRPWEGGPPGRIVLPPIFREITACLATTRKERTTR